MPNIFFINDKTEYNLKYRSNLMNKLSSDYKVTTWGLFDSPIKSLKTLLGLLFLKYTLIVSSNLRTNLFILLIVWKRKIVIINGLGRHRKSKLLRAVILFLINKQFRNNAIFIQNYADYRFFSKFSKGSSEIIWMPGSGGVERQISSASGSISVITRDEKIPTQLASIQDFLSKLPTQISLVLIGIKNDNVLNLKNIPFSSVGYVAQSKILKYSDSVLVPEGYGEGIPHIMVDAIMSNAKVYTSKRNFTQYGFYKYSSYERFPGTEIWLKLIINQELQALVASDRISNIFSQKVSSLIASK